jgi:hypothetical protein
VGPHIEEGLSLLLLHRELTQNYRHLWLDAIECPRKDFVLSNEERHGERRRECVSGKEDREKWREKGRRGPRMKETVEERREMLDVGYEVV